MLQSKEEKLELVDIWNLIEKKVFLIPTNEFIKSISDENVISKLQIKDWDDLAVDSFSN